ncbi:MAG: Wzz/FepE/Etk N-terminal domain-containing protein [Candidatus Aminicenantes bacterium]|nr:Wzz/FepE/Etk N-terminal domain-containing protein [Candidatus Aminicenantes bacterium]
MDTESDELEFADLLRIVFKRRWLILIPTALCVLATGIVSFTMPPVWEVDSVFLPSKFLVQTEQGEFREVVVTDPRQIAGQVNEQSYQTLLAEELKLDLRKFPKIKAENLKDTKLIRIRVREKNIEEGKAILRSLFNRIKVELDAKINVELKGIDTGVTVKKNTVKDLENEIKTRENEIKRKNNEIKLKDFIIQAKDIEKDRLNKEIETDQNKLKISEARVTSITEEMKSVKGRIDDLDQRLKKVISENKGGAEAVSLLLYSNEVQQNLRYYNTLDEKLSIERVAQENLWLSIKNIQENIRQIDTQISQINTEKDIFRIEISTILNEIEKLKNRIDTLQSEIGFLEDKKMRIDYARLVKEPTSSLWPVAPRPLRYTAAAGAISLVLFAVLALLIEYFQNSLTPQIRSVSRKQDQ